MRCISEAEAVRFILMGLWVFNAAAAATAQSEESIVKIMSLNDFILVQFLLFKSLTQSIALHHISLFYAQAHYAE